MIFKLVTSSCGCNGSTAWMVVHRREVQIQIPTKSHDEAGQHGKSRKKNTRHREESDAFLALKLLVTDSSRVTCGGIFFEEYCYSIVSFQATQLLFSWGWMMRNAITSALRAKWCIIMPYESRNNVGWERLYWPSFKATCNTTINHPFLRISVQWRQLQICCQVGCRARKDQQKSHFPHGSRYLTINSSTLDTWSLWKNPKVDVLLDRTCIFILHQNPAWRLRHFKPWCIFFKSMEHTWSCTTNPPTRFGVHSLLFLCSIQNFVTRCPSKIPSPKSKIQDPQNPKSKIPKFQNPNFAHKDLLHNVPKIQNPKSPKSKIQNPQNPKSKIPKFQNPNFAHKDLLHNVPKIQNPKSPKSPKSKIQNPQNPKSKIPKIPKIQNPKSPKSQNPKSKIQNPQNPKSPKSQKSKIQNPQNPKSKIPKIQNPKSPKSKIQAFLAGFWGFWI